ncbi:TPA: glycosyltransferase family 4 protein [Kluyvera cryocrescens]|nr:glycosyltransferase family 4 protein [Kluyvera cryocrescens]
MKYLIISLASGYGGSERTIELIAEELSKENHVTILAENEEHIERLRSRNLDVVEIVKGNSLKATLVNCRIVTRSVSQAEVIIANTNKSAFMLALSRLCLTKINKNKTIIFVRDYQWKFKRIIKILLRGSKFCIASQAVDEYVRNEFSSIPYVIQNPVETIFGITQDKQKYNIIICPAMISRWKGINHLITAVSLLPADYKLKVIGKISDSDYFSELQHQVDELSLQNRIEFLSFEKDISQHYKKCDVVVNSSISEFGGPETFGRTIIEAWQYAKPAISFACGGPKYLIHDGIDGVLVEEGNAVALAQSIQGLMKDDDRRIKMGIAGRARVEREFSLPQVVSRLKEIIAD